MFVHPCIPSLPSIRIKSCVCSLLAQFLQKDARLQPSSPMRFAKRSLIPWPVSHLRLLNHSPASPTRQLRLQTGPRYLATTSRRRHAAHASMETRQRRLIDPSDDSPRRRSMCVADWPSHRPPSHLVDGSP